jgi:hypothetical protein
MLISIERFKLRINVAVRRGGHFSLPDDKPAQSTNNVIALGKISMETRIFLY